MGRYLKLLPLQGALLNAMIPRALPWARRGCPFRAQGDGGSLYGGLPHTSGSRFAPYVRFTFCPIRQVHVLPHTSGSRFAPYVRFTFCPIRHGSRFAPYVRFTFCPIRPERAEAPSPGQRPGLIRTQTCRPVRAKAFKYWAICKAAFSPYSNQYCMREASRVSRSWMDF